MNSKQQLRFFIILFASFLMVNTSYCDDPLPDPPKKLKSEHPRPRQVSLTWERDQSRLNQRTYYKIYQRLYNTYNVYNGYRNYPSYMGQLGIYSGYNFYSTFGGIHPALGRLTSFFQAQYANDPGFRRNRQLNQYVLMDNITVDGLPYDSGHNYGSYSYYGAYSIYGSYQSYWSYTPEEIFYDRFGPLIEWDMDETKRRSEEPIYKIVASNDLSIQTSSLASAESEGKRRNSHGQEKTTLPAPENLRARLLDNGNVGLEWESVDPGDYGLNSFNYKVFRLSYSTYGTYGQYGSYSNYLAFNLINEFTSQTGGTQSYEVDRNLIFLISHEYSGAYHAYHGLSQIGIYKTIVALSPHSQSDYDFSPASPESDYSNPTLNVENGLFHQVCVGHLLEFEVTSINALNQPVSMVANDIGGNGIDINIFKQSQNNYFPAQFVNKSDYALFRWRPSHFVDQELIRIHANDSITGRHTEKDVTIQTLNC